MSISARRVYCFESETRPPSPAHSHAQVLVRASPPGVVTINTEDRPDHDSVESDTDTELDSTGEFSTEDDEEFDSESNSYSIPYPGWENLHKIVGLLQDISNINAIVDKGWIPWLSSTLRFAFDESFSESYINEDVRPSYLESACLALCCLSKTLSSPHQFFLVHNFKHLLKFVQSALAFGSINGRVVQRSLELVIKTVCHLIANDSCAINLAKSTTIVSQLVACVCEVSEGTVTIYTRGFAESALVDLVNNISVNEELFQLVITELFVRNHLLVHFRYLLDGKDKTHNLYYGPLTRLFDAVSQRIKSSKQAKYVYVEVLEYLLLEALYGPNPCYRSEAIQSVYFLSIREAPSFIDSEIICVALVQLVLNTEGQPLVDTASTLKNVLPWLLRDKREEVKKTKVVTAIATVLKTKRPNFDLYSNRILMQNLLAVLQMIFETGEDYYMTEFSEASGTRAVLILMIEEPDEIVKNSAAELLALIGNYPSYVDLRVTKSLVGFLPSSGTDYSSNLLRLLLNLSKYQQSACMIEKSGGIPRLLNIVNFLSPYLKQIVLETVINLMGHLSIEVFAHDRGIEKLLHVIEGSKFTSDFLEINCKILAVNALQNYLTIAEYRERMIQASVLSILVNIVTNFDDINLLASTYAVIHQFAKYEDYQIAILSTDCVAATVRFLQRFTNSNTPIFTIYPTNYAAADIQTQTLVSATSTLYCLSQVQDARSQLIKFGARSALQHLVCQANPSVRDLAVAVLYMLTQRGNETQEIKDFKTKMIHSRE